MKKINETEDSCIVFDEKLLNDISIENFNKTSYFIDGNILVDSGNNDFYKVNSEKDIVVETADGGTSDTISSLVSYELM